MPDLPYTQLDAAPLVAPVDPEAAKPALFSRKAKFTAAGLLYFATALLGQFYIAYPVIRDGPNGDGDGEPVDPSNGFLPAFLILFFLLCLGIMKTTHIWLFTIHGLTTATLGVGVQITVTKWLTIAFSHNTGIPMATVWGFIWWSVVGTIVAVLDIMALSYITKKLAASIKFPDVRRDLPYAGMFVGFVTAVTQVVLQYWLCHGAFPFPFAAAAAGTSSFSALFFGMFATFWNVPIMMWIGWFVGAAIAEKGVDFIRRRFAKEESTFKTMFVPMCVRILGNILAVAFVMRHKLAALFGGDDEHSEPISQ